MNVMSFNHPETIPHQLVCGKTVFPQNQPRCQKPGTPCPGALFPGESRAFQRRLFSVLRSFYHIDKLLASLRHF